jgi:hypothetical protein
MKDMMRRLPLIAAIAALPLVACTPQEVQQWQTWHAADPVAADAYADAVRAEQPADVAPEPAEGAWDRLAQCESGGNWSINSGNGYYGGLQFSASTWRAVGGSGYPHEHSRAEQIHRAEILRDSQGWSAWPACSRRLGLR